MLAYCKMCVLSAGGVHVQSVLMVIKCDHVFIFYFIFAHIMTDFDFYFELVDLVLPSADPNLSRKTNPGRGLRTKGLRHEVNKQKNKHEHCGEETRRFDPGTSELVRPDPAGLQRQPEGSFVLERNRRQHGKAGGGGEAEMEKPPRQVLQGEEANGQEKLHPADGRRQPAGEARPGAVQPAGLAQRLCQAQTRIRPGGDRRGVCPVSNMSVSQHVFNMNRVT